MFSSKVIKIKDKDNSEVRTFCLQQFPEHSGEEKPKQRGSGLPVRNRPAGEFGLAEAKTMRNQAQTEARQIVANARKEAVNIEKQAYEEGYKQGERDGRKHAEGELAAVITALRGIADDYEVLKRSYYADHQGALLDLALLIARKVIHQEVSTNRELVLDVLRSAVNLCVDRESLKIRLNKDDMGLCLEKKPELMQEFDGIKSIVFEPDDTVGTGGAIVDYAFGEIDARLDLQLAEVERELVLSLVEKQSAN